MTLRRWGGAAAVCVVHWRINYISFILKNDVDQWLIRGTGIEEAHVGYLRADSHGTTVRFTAILIAIRLATDHRRTVAHGEEGGVPWGGEGRIG